MINGKKYIGQSINIYDRYEQHKNRYKISNDSGYNGAFHRALRKYGWNNFDFDVLEECSPKKLDEREQFWIKKEDSLSPNGYNLTIGGQRNRTDFSKRICPLCGKTKSKASKICLCCYNKERKEYCKIPSNKIDIGLVDEILSTSFESVAKKYGYKSGNSIKKILKINNLPVDKNELFSYYENYTGKKHKKIIEEEDKYKRKQQNKQKFLPKTIGQYNLDGKLIKVFSSTKEAQKYTGINSGHISECANGKRKRTKEYIWKYL